MKVRVGSCFSFYFFWVDGEIFSLNFYIEYLKILVFDEMGFFWIFFKWFFFINRI